LVDLHLICCQRKWLSRVHTKFRKVIGEWKDKESDFMQIAFQMI